MTGTGNSGKRQEMNEVVISALLEYSQGGQRLRVMETISPNLDWTPVWVSCLWNRWTTGPRVHVTWSDANPRNLWDLRFTCLSWTDSPDWNMLSRKPGLRVESQFRELFTSLNSNYNHSTILTNLVPYVGQLQLGKFMANRSHIYSVVKKKTCLNILYKYTLIKMKG